MNFRKVIAPLVGIMVAFTAMFLCFLAIAALFGFTGSALVAGMMIGTFLGLPAGAMAQEAVLGKAPSQYWRELAPELSRGLKVLATVAVWLVGAGVVIALVICGAGSIFAGWPTWAVVITILLVLILLK